MLFRSAPRPSIRASISTRRMTSQTPRRTGWKTSTTLDGISGFRVTEAVSRRAGLIFEPTDSDHREARLCPRFQQTKSYGLCGMAKLVRVRTEAARAWGVGLSSWADGETAPIPAAASGCFEFRNRGWPETQTETQSVSPRLVRPSLAAGHKEALRLAKSTSGRDAEAE